MKSNKNLFEKVRTFHRFSKNNLKYLLVCNFLVLVSLLFKYWYFDAILAESEMSFWKGALIILVRRFSIMYADIFTTST